MGQQPFARRVLCLLFQKEDFMTTILEPQTTVRYVDPNVHQIINWTDAGLCAFCGSVPDGDRCRCRFCDSCTQTWVSNTLHDYSDGRPSWEYCPECIAPTEAVIAKCELCKAKLSAFIPAWAAEDTGDTDAQKLIDDLIGDAKWDRKDIGLVCRKCLERDE